MSVVVSCPPFGKFLVMCNVHYATMVTTNLIYLPECWATMVGDFQFLHHLSPCSRQPSREYYVTGNTGEWHSKLPDLLNPTCSNESLAASIKLCLIFKHEINIKHMQYTSVQTCACKHAYKRELNLPWGPLSYLTSMGWTTHWHTLPQWKHFQAAGHWHLVTQTTA